MNKAKTIGAIEAKTHLAQLLRDTVHGKSFIITRRGKAVAELRPVRKHQAPAKKVQWGDMKGRIRLADDFCAPLDDMKDYME